MTNDKKRAFPTPKAEQNFTRWTNNNATRLPADMAGAFALIDTLTVQRDAAEALAREAISKEVYQDMADTYEAEFKAHHEAKADRDAAQQMVAEMRDVLEGCARPCGCKHPACRFCEDDSEVAAALALSAPIANRWCLASERDGAVRQIREDLDATNACRFVTEARAETSDAAARALGDDYTRVLRECVAAERRESELGLQVVAQAARLRLATDLIAQVRGGLFSPRDLAALAAWDAVPGDQGGEG